MYYILFKYLTDKNTVADPDFQFGERGVANSIEILDT